MLGGNSNGFSKVWQMIALYLAYLIIVRNACLVIAACCIK
jgi:hypothetical protein